MKNSVAIIGSFRKFYPQVVKTIGIFKELNIEVTSPLGSSIIEEGVPFVRFSSDNPSHSDEMVQTITLKKIFSASVVYVVCPDGYIGRTTCYEVGRIIQSRMPIYFSNKPNDLPIKVPLYHIVSPKILSKLIINNKIRWPFEKIDCELASEERKIASIMGYGKK